MDRESCHKGGSYRMQGRRAVFLSVHGGGRQVDPLSGKPLELLSYIFVMETVLSHQPCYGFSFTFSVSKTYFVAFLGDIAGILTNMI